MIEVKRNIVNMIAVVLIIVVISITGVLLTLESPQNINHFTYPISVADKTYTVALETNWDKENPPTVSPINASAGRAVELYFRGGEKKSVTYNITIPTDLIAGNVSLIWKYYLQNPDRYVLSNNGTHNSLRMTFNYDPNFSGMGYFVIMGTKIT
ncbi:hypothetical protein GX563_02525 [Candidatus Bathyarchaeota archaeon]|nr:hypothetical protein [Candidatus Bathyarchaeota archaeon]